jgi:glutathione peroxidase
MTTAHDFSFKSIDGGALPMSKFKGKAVLVVNVASQCGLTPQYSGLEALWKKKADTGLVVLGVRRTISAPGPGPVARPSTFARRVNIDFPMTKKKTSRAGAIRCKWLAGRTRRRRGAQWNFHKYLINKDGTIAGGVRPTHHAARRRSDERGDRCGTAEILSRKRER